LRCYTGAHKDRVASLNPSEIEKEGGFSSLALVTRGSVNWPEMDPQKKISSDGARLWQLPRETVTSPVRDPRTGRLSLNHQTENWSLSFSDARLILGRQLMGKFTSCEFCGTPNLRHGQVRSHLARDRGRRSAWLMLKLQETRLVFGSSEVGKEWKWEKRP